MCKAPDLKRIIYILILTLLFFIDRSVLSHFDMRFWSAVPVLMFPLFLALTIMELLAPIGLRNPKFAMWAILISVILFEGLLRVRKVNQTYLERIGKMEYRSPYAPDKQNSLWQLYPPDDTMEYFRGDFTYRRTSNHIGTTETKTDPNDTSTHKILCLGDSFTEGIGTEADSAWPRALERNINMCTPVRYQIYNAGIAGSDPVYEYHLLRHKLWDTKWDAVIFCVNNTDIPECNIRGGMERFRGDSVQFNTPPFWEPLYATSYFVRFLILNVLHYDWTFRSSEQQMQATRDLSKVLHLAEQELSKKGCTMMVVVHPLSYDILGHGYMQEFDTLRLCIKDLHPLDLYPYLADSIHIDSSNYTKFYWKNDGHFNGTGYQIIGDKIARELSHRMNLSCGR